VTRRALAALALLLTAAAPRLHSQERGAAALGQSLAGLGTTTRVLMIGAHPDDEDTQLISFLATGRHIETAYLSLTRGDGGQNLIGNELGEVLGMIRTEELLAARRIDGGRQYFSRAFDFGFTKTLDEALERWPKDSVLKDAVAIVRAFRPQVIIAVFTGTPADGHGQHQYSGVIAREVFDAAADTVRFPPSQLGGLKAWAPAKFYRLRRNAQNATLEFNVGEYSPLLGESYSEIATVSRSQHSSQGQGALPQRGRRFSGVALEASRVSSPSAREQTLFDGIDSSWARFKDLALPDSARAALDSLPGAERAVREQRDLANPTTLVAPLAAYVRLATRAQSGVDCTTLDALDATMKTCDAAHGDLALALATTKARASEALLDASGVVVEATAPREYVAVGETMPVTVTLYNQGEVPVGFESVALTNALGMASRQPRTIPPDSIGVQTMTYNGGVNPTLPWWLRRPRRGDMFQQPLHEMIVGEDRLESSGVETTVRIAGVGVPVRSGPIVYRFADPARGEVRRPVATIPEVSVLMQREIEYARANVPFDRTMLVYVHSGSSSPRDVSITLELPAGLTADSATRKLTLPAFGDANLYFHVTGRLATGRHRVRAVATVGGKTSSVGFVPVEYSHIRPLRYYRPAEVQLEAVNATFANLKVGYVKGVGDNVMPMLEELGIPVTELDPASLAQVKLDGFTTIVLGPRAYEASPALVANNSVLMNFARRGGTVVVQYGQSAYARLGVLPYPFSLTGTGQRVTDENAAVRVVDPGSPLLAAPNKIGDADFAGWVQERTSYMPTNLDSHYRTVFSLNDPNEPPSNAAVLVAPLGKGTYVYTTFSFFRQLPAGNPGAAKLFINLLSATPAAANRPPIPPTVPVKP
jgi:LmbE family N-acetylglucosaminyl deacetylase